MKYASRDSWEREKAKKKEDAAQAKRRQEEEMQQRELSRVDDDADGGDIDDL